jgi:geranylgeranyl pyrophosphate synthase
MKSLAELQAIKNRMRDRVVLRDGMEGIPAFRDYGSHYGRLFQLRDDLADNEATPFTNDLIEQEKAILDAIKL